LHFLIIFFFSSFSQIITKYVYELLQKECHLKKVTLPVSVNFFVSKEVVRICKKQSLGSGVRMKTRCARALCRALSRCAACASSTCVQLEVWFHLGFMGVLSPAELSSPDTRISKMWQTLSFLKSVCECSETSTAGCREHTCL